MSGDDGKVTSVSRSGSYTFYVNITLDALDDDNDYDLYVDGLEWDESDGNAYWDDAEDAKRYEVRLYRGGNSVTSVVSTSDTSYDFPAISPRADTIISGCAASTTPPTRAAGRSRMSGM